MLRENLVLMGICKITQLLGQNIRVCPAGRPEFLTGTEVVIAKELPEKACDPEDQHQAHPEAGSPAGPDGKGPED